MKERRKCLRCATLWTQPLQLASTFIHSFQSNPEFLIKTWTSQHKNFIEPESVKPTSQIYIQLVITVDFLLWIGENAFVEILKTQINICSRICNFLQQTAWKGIFHGWRIDYMGKWANMNGEYIYRMDAEAAVLNNKSTLFCIWAIKVFEYTQFFF